MERKSLAHSLRVIKESAIETVESETSALLESTRDDHPVGPVGVLSDRFLQACAWVEVLRTHASQIESEDWSGLLSDCAVQALEIRPETGLALVRANLVCDVYRKLARMIGGSK